MFALLNDQNTPQEYKTSICDLLILIAQQQKVKQLMNKKEVSVLTYLKQAVDQSLNVN